MTRFQARGSGPTKVVLVPTAAERLEARNARAAADSRLETALEDTFPASDPIAVSLID